MRRKRILSLALVFILTLSQFGIFQTYAQTDGNNEGVNEYPKAPINMVKEVEKNQFLLNEEVTINYKIQPQPIPVEDIIPESYLKDKEIVLVMDTSGSMAWDIYSGGSSDKRGNYTLDNNRNKVYYYLDDNRNTVYYRIEKHRGRQTPVYYYLQKDGENISYKDNVGNIIKPRITVAKEAAKSFIDKLKEDDKVKVALTPYEKYARDVSFYSNDFANLSDANQYQQLINNIKSLIPNGGTNIGDGLRKAYYKFSSSDENTRKYVILMTDGKPTFHSSTWKWEYNYSSRRWEKREVEQYFKNGTYPNDYSYFGGGNYTTNDDREYANKVARDLILNGDHKIDSFMIAFSNDADKNELKNIANSANGYYKEAIDANALDEVYQKLAEQIQSDLPIHGINFQETFPEGMKVIDASEGLEINGQTVTGDIGSISYTLNEETKQFEAKPFEFFIKLKGSKAGDYDLGKDSNDNSTSYIDYKDIDGSDGHKSFPQINISVYEKEPPEISAYLTVDEGDENGYKLDLTINEPANIEIFNIDGRLIWSANKKGEQPYQATKTFPINLNKADLSGDHIIIKAEDKFNNKVEETVPLVKSISIEDQGWSQVDQTLKGILNIETQSNSTITSIKVNGREVGKDKLTDEGKYAQSISLKDGNNEIEITVKNGYNNVCNLRFREATNKKLPITSITRTFPFDPILASSEYKLVYNIDGEQIKYTKEKPVEIVLVLNTSGTMTNYIQGRNNSDKNKGKLVKAAKSFIDNLPDDKNIKVGVVRYYHTGEVVSQLEDISNKDTVKTRIESIKNSINGTNLGDGLRRAYQLLEKGNSDADKHLVILSDGFANVGIKNLECTSYIFDLGEDINDDIERNRYRMFPLEKNNLNKFIDGYKGNGDEFEKRVEVGTEYVTGIAQQINESDIKINSHIIHFERVSGNGTPKEAMQNNNEVARVLGVTKEINPGQKFYLANNAESLIEAFNDVGNAIEDSIPFEKFEYEEIFPAGVELVEYPSGLEIDPETTLETGYRLTGNISGINMKKVPNESNLYEVDGEFNIKVKCNNSGIYKFNQGNVQYTDPFGCEGETTVNDGTITVKALPEVNIKVRDTSGEIEKDKQYNVTSEDTDGRIDKILKTSIVLQGDAYADISVKGEDTDFFEYQFIKKSEKPEVMPESGWINIDLNKETINEDVIKEKQGYLNKRSYDVSHMKTMENESDWNNPDLVFKAPFEATTYKSTKYSSNSSQYGQWEEYTKKDGTKSKRWSTNSVFMNEMDVAWSSGSENLDYKEASKFWGYIKVPKDGEYSFGVKSDDGCKGYITVNGETKAFVDMLRVQSSTFGTTQNKYKLKADKYYPIYLEYFNWGGRAQFEMVYSDSGLVQDNSQKVEANWFYPSKDNSPGEYTKTIFTGNKGVKFPTEAGDYYIAFRTGKDGKVTRKGIYGAFTVEGETELTISKRIIGGNKVQEKNDFTLEYTIEPPSEIPAISTLKENGEYKDKIYLTNIQIVDEYPENIKNDLNSAQKITKTIPNIEYTKATRNGETVYKYLGGPIKVEVNLSAKKSGDYVLSEKSKSKIIFTDFNKKANKEQEFTSININVVERKQVEFDFERTINKDKVQVDEKFEITYNMKPSEITGIDPSISNLSDEDIIKNITFTETLPKGIKIDKNTLPDGVTVIDNTITWNIGSITYKLSGDKYVPSVGDKEFKIKVTASSEEEGTYDLENATITYEDIDKSIVTKNIDEVDTITVENEIQITTGMIINGQFKSNTAVDLVKGFEIDLGAKIENVKGHDIVLEIRDQDQDKINISKDKVKIYEGIDEKSSDFSNPLSNINITTKGKGVKIETSNIEEKKNYTIIYNVEALKDSSIGSANVNIRVNSEEATHQIKIVPLPNLE